MAMPEEPGSANAHYVTDENGKRVGVIPGIEEYGRIMDELEELEDIRAYDEAKAELESGEDELVLFEQAMKEIDEGRVGR